MCELLTPAEIEDALGQPVAAEITATIDCRYTTTHTGTFDATEISVSIVRPAPGTTESFERIVQASVGPAETTQRIDGLGDAAVLVRTAELTVLNVRTSETWLTLGVTRDNGSDALSETLSQLARIALQRLR